LGHTNSLGDYCIIKKHELIQSHLTKFVQIWILNSLA
jgi:hypothetical protein